MHTPLCLNHQKNQHCTCTLYEYIVHLQKGCGGASAPGRSLPCAVTALQPSAAAAVGSEAARFDSGRSVDSFDSRRSVGTPVLSELPSRPHRLRVSTQCIP